jgi:hypothetical protein
MKNQLTLKKLMFRHGSFGSAMAALLLLAASALPTLADDGTVCNPGIIPPVVPTNPYGHTYAEWSAKWWQWSLEQSTSNLELISKPDAYDGHVRFLAGGLLQQSTGGAASLTNQLTISSGTPLFFTIISTWDDNSGCPFTSFTADQLTAAAEGLWTSVTATTCTIDGHPVAGLSNPATTSYLVLTPPFSYTTAKEGNVLAGIFGDECIDGETTIYPAVADGVYLMLSPLSPGKHTIHTVGIVGPVSAPYVVEDITYDITVLQDSGINCR